MSSRASLFLLNNLSISQLKSGPLLLALYFLFESSVRVIFLQVCLEFHVAVLAYAFPGVVLVLADFELPYFEIRIRGADVGKSLSVLRQICRNELVLLRTGG